MKIHKIFLFIIGFACYTLSVTFKSQSKSKKLLAAEEVLDSLQKFNNKYANVNGRCLFNLI